MRIRAYRHPDKGEIEWWDTILCVSPAPATIADVERFAREHVSRLRFGFEVLDTLELRFNVSHIDLQRENGGSFEQVERVARERLYRELRGFLVQNVILNRITITENRAYCRHYAEVDGGGEYAHPITVPGCE